MKIDLARQGNFILALLLIHFIFFGYLSNVFPKESTEFGTLSEINKPLAENIVFLYRVMFSPEYFLSAIILFIIVFIMVFRERFYEYGIRNSIWLVPFIIVESWIWYFFIYEFNLLIIPIYFIRIESYITILSLLGINLLAAILAAFAKQKYIQFFKKYKTVVIT